MAVFKAIEQRARAIRKVVAKAKSITTKLTQAINALFVFLKAVITLSMLATRALILMKRIIQALRSVLARTGRLAGPIRPILISLQVIFDVLNKSLGKFERLLILFTKASNDLLGALRYKGASFLNNRFKKLLKRVDTKAMQVENLARLLEEQQKWLEKILPPAYIAQLWSLEKALEKPLSSIIKLTKKIIAALNAFIKKLAGLQKETNDLQTQIQSLDVLLQQIARAADTVNGIITSLDNFLKNVPGVRFVISAFQSFADVINRLIRITGIRESLKQILDKSGIIDALLRRLNQFIFAIEGLIIDFKEIIDDILKMIADLTKALNILNTLCQMLRLIAILKWFFGFMFHLRLEALEKGLRWLVNSNAAIPFISTRNRMQTRVDSIAIKGKGIGNDWSFQFSINGQSQTIEIDRKGSRAVKANEVIAEETFSNIPTFVTNELTILAIESDQTFDDVGEFSERIQIKNIAQETSKKIEFTVEATGGDKGATATITVEFSFVVEAVEDILIPLSELGRENEAINYLEHTLENLKSDIGKFQMAPGLLAQQHGVHEFIYKADNLLNALKNDLVNGEDIAGKVDQFLGLVAESRVNLIPAEEMNFEPSYFVELFESSELEDSTDIILEMFEAEEEFVAIDFAAIDIFNDEALFEPILTTKNENNIFDFNPNLDSTPFIGFDNENPLES